MFVEQKPPLEISQSMSDMQTLKHEIKHAHQEEELHLREYVEQASGHSKMYISSDGATIFKPCNPQENEVYQKLQKGPMVPFIPEYLGVKDYQNVGACHTIRASQIEGQFIVLQNLTAGYRSPCIMDIKMGIKDEGGPTKNRQVVNNIKPERQSINSIPSRWEFGFRFSGIRVYKPDRKEFLVDQKPKDYSVRHALDLFFDSNPCARRFIPGFIQKLEALQQTLAKQTVEFRGSSILLLYDASCDADDSRFDVRLVDFDKAQDKTSPISDEWGVIAGVNSLISHLRTYRDL